MGNNSENMVEKSNVNQFTKMEKEMMDNIISGANKNDMIQKINTMVQNTSSSQTNQVSASTNKVTGGDVLINNGKLYEAEGYIKINNENRTVYADVNTIDDILDGRTKYICDENGNLQKIEATDIRNVKVDGKSYYINKTQKTLLTPASTIEASKNDANLLNSNDKKTITISNIGSQSITKTTSFYDGKSNIKGGSTVIVNSKALKVSGYAIINGQKRIIYSDPDRPWYKTHQYYVGKDGRLHITQMELGAGNSRYYKVDGEECEGSFVSDGDDEGFEPSDIDKEWLASGNPATQTETPTEPQPTEPTTAPSYINVNIPLKFSCKREIYKIYYGVQGGSLIKGGEYTAPERRTVAIETYKKTPGLGITAKQSAENFERYIAKIRYILREDAWKYSYNAVIKNGKSLGSDEIKKILDLSKDIPITVFRRFSENISRVIKYADQEQKKANKRKYQEAEKSKNISILRYKETYKLTEEAKKIPNPIFISKIDTLYIHDNFGAYSYYLKGNEEFNGVTPTSSIRLAGKAKLNNKTGIYVSKKHVLRIIDDFSIILGLIKNARKNIDDSVNVINKIPEHSKILGAQLVPEIVGGPLIELEKSIKKIKSKYEYWYKLVDDYSKKDSKKDSGGGKKPTPKTTPKTEVPTERPTEIITQPTTPPTTAPTTPSTSTPSTQPSNNGGNNYNGGDNYSGGNDYSDYGNESSVETPASEAPTTPTFDEDVIKEGNSYKLPTSTKPVAPTTTTSSKGNGVIPVLAGLSAAAAAGIGAKAYMDRKKNRDNDEEEEFKAEDWSENTDVNMEYQEPEGEKVESLDFDDGVEDTPETERYGARTQQDLQDLQ